MTDSDAFLSAIATINPDEARCRALAEKIGEVIEGHNAAEVMMALCFHLHEIVEIAPAGTHAGILAGLIRLIDPEKGHG